MVEKRTFYLNIEKGNLNTVWVTADDGFDRNEAEAKRDQLLKALVPHCPIVAVSVNDQIGVFKKMEEGASAVFSQEMRVIEIVSTPKCINLALDEMKKWGGQMKRTPGGSLASLPKKDIKRLE